MGFSSLSSSINNNIVLSLNEATKKNHCACNNKIIELNTAYRTFFFAGNLPGSDHKCLGIEKNTILTTKPNKLLILQNYWLN